MHFIVDNVKKWIVGWSAKCGCTHIKYIMYYLITKKSYRDELNIEGLHTFFGWGSLPSDISEFTIVLIIRDPYKRLVSGFLDKYTFYNNYYSLWRPNISLTFANFVSELKNNSWIHIDHHHFTPQLSEAFDFERIKNHSKMHIFDIEKIDYKLFESIYNKKIPEDIIRYKGSHTNIRKTSMNQNVSYLDAFLYNRYLVPYTFFYNKELKDAVYQFYKKDFDFFREYGFHFDFQLDS
jgi:hypothetical protein